MGNKIFASRIKKLRNDKKLSLEGLANELGINKSRIGMWENNGTVPRDSVLIQLSKFFDVSIDYLLGNDSMEAKEPDSSKKLEYLQRGLGKLDQSRLEKAEKMLSVMFDDIFENYEDEDDGI
ncbi:MAG: helix-turn-helix transcriptional regulator [Clostridiales bacterium]|nr:helix-turn-helix transcriptional regulator [Clostridiales bacterium]